MSGYAAQPSSGLRHRRTFIYLALALMTASWITGLLWALLVDAGPPLPVTLSVLTLLVLIPLGLSRWLRGLELQREMRRAILIGTFVFIALLVLSSGFYNDYGLFGTAWLNSVLGDELSSETFLNQVTSLLLVTLCWGLGVVLGDTRLTSVNLVRYFYASIAILVAPAIYFVSDVSQDAAWLYYICLFAGLVALGLGRVEEVSRRSQERSSPFTSYWLAQISLTAVLILAIVEVANVLGLGNGVGLIMALIAPIVTILIFPIVYAGAKILVLSGFRLSVSFSDAGPTDTGPVGEQATQAAQPSTLQSLCAGLLFIAFTFLVVRLVLFSARRWRQMMQDTGEEEKAAVPSRGAWLSEAVQERLIRTGLNLPGLGRIRRRLVARSVRRIYAAMTALAAERGYPRPPSRTPYEHRRTLRQAFPDCEAQVALITEAYVAVHYGQAPESRDALQEIKSAWMQVNEAARQSAPVSPTERQIAASLSKAEGTASAFGSQERGRD